MSHGYLLRTIGFALRELDRYPKYLWRSLRRPARVRVGGVWIEVDAELGEETRRLLYSARYERGERRCVSLTLASDDVVLEVGAGIGFLSALCAKRIGSERVHAYEANPRLIERIRANHRLNGVSPTVTNAVLGAAAGRVPFHLADNFFSSSLEAGAGERIDVPQLDVAAEFERLQPTFVIMDIEGGELDLVPRIPWQGVRKLAIELHPRQLGESGMRTVLDGLAVAGLREVRLLSSHRKRYFARETPS